MRLHFSLLASVLLLGCSSDDESAGNQPTDTDWSTLSTAAYELAPGGEQYLCYAETLTEDMVVDAFRYRSTPEVHHLLVAKPFVPEPEGLVECGSLFKQSWIPMFGVGTSDNDLTLPEGAGYDLRAGQQVLIQLHLLNSTNETVQGTASVDMHVRTDLAEPTPIGIYAFGTDRIQLPPRQPSDVVNDCSTKHDVELFAILPHMHFLGQSLTLEVGSDEASLSEVYRKDAWDFDQQTIEPIDLSIPKGAYTRTRCAYDNPSDDTILFGESSNEEMCFLVGFQLDNSGLDGCVQYGGDD